MAEKTPAQYCAKEIAGLLGCSDRSAVRLLRAGIMKGFRLSGDSGPWRITHAAYLDYLDQRQSAAAELARHTAAQRAAMIESLR